LFNTEFFALSWWLALLGALFLSVVAAYLTRAIDFIFSLVSSKWKVWAQQRREKFEALVVRYANDHQLTALAGYDMIIYTLRPLLMLILSGVMLLLYVELNFRDSPYARIPVLALVPATFLSIFLDLFFAIKSIRIVRAVHSRRLQLDPTASPPV
jgi:hypothetical protein